MSDSTSADRSRPGERPYAGRGAGCGREETGDRMSLGRQSLCLCMIVKNEAKILERCIHSTRGLISHWVICDTGSSDDTREIVRRELADIPGELHERPWVDFGHNRSELMALALGRADYLLLMDADMSVVSRGMLPALTADSYRLRQGDESYDYRNKRIVRGDLPWHFVGPPTST